MFKSNTIIKSLLIAAALSTASFATVNASAKSKPIKHSVHKIIKKKPTKKKVIQKSKTKTVDQGLQKHNANPTDTTNTKPTTVTNDSSSNSTTNAETDTNNANISPVNPQPQLVSQNSKINPVQPYTGTTDDGDIANPNNVDNAGGTTPWSTDSRNHPVVDTLFNGNQIYYQNNTDSMYHDAVEQAINNWNSLNVIKLVPLPQNDATDAAISITDHTDQDANAAAHDYGNTYMNYLSSPDASTAIMASANVVLEPLSDNKSYDFKVYVAEHEIGHTLGFAHDPYTKVSGNAVASHIMHGGKTTDVIPLGQKEANALRQHYNLP